MSDDSDGEGFYDDPFEVASDGEDFRGDSFDDEEEDDGCLGLCGGPSDEEGDDDSNGEEMCEVPCCYDDDDDASDSEDLCGSPREDDDGDGESEEALSEDDADLQDDEEVCDEEGNGGEGDEDDDPCDEDEEEGDGESQDLCEDHSSNDGEGGELEVFSDGTDISDSVKDDYSSSEVEDERVTPVSLALPAPWAVQMVLGAEDTDSDDDINNDIDYDSDGTDYDDYEVHRLPASHVALESLPEATLGKEEAACDCAVCKEVFESAQRVVWLPCKHYFHGDCIRPWLAIRSTCPVCRYQLPTDDAESRQGQAHQLRVLEPVAPHSETQQAVAEPPQAQGPRAGSGHEQSSP